jgi:Tol biopolymer transport system component
MSRAEAQYPIPRMFASRLSRLLFLAVPLALAACDGAESPLAPVDAPAAPAVEPPVSALLTATADQRIVFQSYRSGNGDIYKMDTKGSHLVRLTGTSDEDRVPAWSYDNTRIALVRPRLDASNVSHDDIYVINADGTGGHWARSQPSPWRLGDPSWSPDGSHLVLYVVVGSIAYLGRMDLATGQISLINGAGVNYEGQQPSYDRTGQKIVYVGPGLKNVYQIKADGTGLKVLVSSTAYVQKPAYSPDGKKLAYSKTVTGDVELFVKNLVDGTTRRLTTSAGEDYWPSWSPDGSRIAFISRRSGTLQIWTMGANGGSPLRITNTTGTELYPQWSH